MTLAAGDRIGPYEVVAPLGSGGMGDVFRARDARLKRDVALKVLLISALTDPDRRARFEREAQVLASLNHPNIAQVYGVELNADAPVIVMELVEGPTLAERLEQGALPIDEALPMAIEVCDGLEAAHERGIVHRDLKPANIKVRAGGGVKILDFGLARVLSDEAVDAANSPTVLGGRTEMGLVLGTAAYMSPEQARGRVVDKRADIWAFGCVLYEMLAGVPAFAGESTTDILAGVVQQEPDWSRLPPGLPARVDELLRRCLQKQVKDRLRDIADARFEIAPALRSLADRSTSSARVANDTVSLTVRRVNVPLGWLAAGAVVGAILVTGFSALRTRPTAPEAPTRASISLPADVSMALLRGSSVVLSPDGRQLAFVGRAKGKVQLYLRSLDRFESRPLEGTDEAANPFFSPDGRWLGFFADGKLKKVSLDGGAPVTIADARTPRGEVWGPDNTIFLTPINAAGISRVSAQGGKLDEVTSLRPGQLSHRWPRLLPDGSALLFTIWNDVGWEPSRIAAQRLNGGEPKIVVESGGGYGRYIRDGSERHGYLVYARSEGLLAAPFDEASLALTGQAVPVVDSVITNLSGGAHFDLSPSGTLAYVPGTMGEADRELVWVTLDGKVEPALKIRGMGRMWSLSPDGTRVARNNTVGPSRDIWIEDLTRHTTTRLTNSVDNFNAIWSSDGKWVVFARGTPTTDLIRRSTDGRGVEERLTASLNVDAPSSLSPDGTLLAYSKFDPVSGSDIWILSLPAVASGQTASSPRPFLKTNFSEGNAIFSRDGHWLAYQSNESGRFEIYVRGFPDGQTFAVSTDGGIVPSWSATGREILYRGMDNKMMAVPIDTAPNGRIGKPRVLFDATSYENVYGVAPDGVRLLMMPLIATEQSATQVNIVFNFLAELRQRVR